MVSDDPNENLKCIEAGDSFDGSILDGTGMNSASVGAANGKSAGVGAGGNRKKRSARSSSRLRFDRLHEFRLRSAAMSPTTPTANPSCGGGGGDDDDPEVGRSGARKPGVLVSPRGLNLLLLAVLLLFFVVIVVLGVRLNLVTIDLRGRCQTPACLRSAARILANLDESVDPCTDFQRFACGGYFAKRPLDAEHTRVDLLSEQARADGVLANVRQLIDAISPEEENRGSSVLAHVARFAASCFDDRALLSMPNTNFISTLRDLGGWEPLSATMYDIHTWNFDRTLRALIKDYGVFPFFRVGLTPVANDTKNLIVTISPSGFGLGANRANYDRRTKPYLYHAYLKFINKVLIALRDRNRDENSEDKGADIFFFEDRLLQTTELRARNISRDIVPRTLGELRRLVPSIRWLEVISDLFPQAPVNSDFLVLVDDEGYFRNLGSVLSTARDSVLNLYMMWHFTMKYVPFMDRSVRTAEARFRAEINGGQLEKLEHEAIFSRCLELTADFYGLALAHMYRDRYNLNTNIQAAKKLVSRISGVAREKLYELPWLNHGTGLAKRRLESLNVSLGYPDIAESDTKVTEYYREAQSNRYFLGNMVEQNRVRLKWITHAFSTHQDLTKKAEIARQVLSWSQNSPLEIKPKYSYELNEVTVPLGMLSEPMFSVKDVAAVQMATVAMVAQQALRAIDGIGLQFAASAAPTTSRTNATLAAVAELRQCLAAHTNNELHAYGPLDAHVDDAIADIAGLSVALRIFDDVTSSRELDVDDSHGSGKLPGLDYEPRQLFYIAYGQTMCENLADNRVVYTNGTTTPAPLRLRLHRTLQQTADFADTFACPASSRMVPSQRCDVW